VVAATASVQPGLTSARVPYAGVATRAVALAVDVVIVNVLVLLGAGLLGLVASLVDDLRPEWLAQALIAVGWGLSVAVYFVLFWSITGQTPGMRAMRLRVIRESGSPPSLARAFVRLIGLLIAIVPMFAGFIPVLFDDRRRGLPDYLAGTVVVYADPAPVAA
jgi:uncharacterized RDD family membrane protein YckC